MIDFLLPWECIGPKEQYFLIHSRKDENQAHILAWKTLIMLQQWYKYAKCRNLQAGKMPTHWYQSDKYFNKLNIQRKRMKIYLTLDTPQPWSLITSPALWRCWQRCWWGSCCLDATQYNQLGQAAPHYFASSPTLREAQCLLFILNPCQ